MRKTLSDVDTHIEITGLKIAGPETTKLGGGATDTVLLLHGNPDSADMWRPLIERLPEYRCVAPDLPGFGRSVTSKAFNRRLTERPLESMAEWVAEVVRSAVEVDRIHLVVHDFGGPYGLSWALRHEERVASITVIDSLFFSDYRWHFWARVWRTRGLGELSMYLFSWTIFRWEMRRGSPGLSDEQLRETWKWVDLSMKKMVLTLYRATDSEIFRGFDDQLRGLMAERPSLALWGENDPYIAHRWAHRLGAQKVEIASDRGHWLPVEDPDWVAERIRALLAEAQP